MISDAQTLARTRVHPRAQTHVPFDVRITPHNSLPADRLLMVIAGIISVSVVFQGVLLAAGAWPGAIFVAFDSLLLTCALIVMQSRMQRQENVRIDGTVITVERIARGERCFEQRLICCRLAIERHEDPEFGLRTLFLRDGTSRLEIARDLSPPERESFCDALLKAVCDQGFRPRVEVRRLGLHPLE